MNTTALQGPQHLQWLLSSRTTLVVVLEASIYSFFALTALFGNVLVLMVVYKTPRLHNTAGILFTSLAVSDIAMALLESPHTLSSVIAGKWVGGFMLCQFTGFTIITLACASLQTMCLMALDRFYRVCYPTQHRTVFSTKRTKLFVVLSWLVAATVHIPYTVSGGLYTFHPGKTFCFGKFSLLSSLVYVYVALPLIVLSFCYFKIFLALKTNSRRVKNLQEENNASIKLTVEDIKLTRTLFVTVLGYLICWTPIMIIDFIDMALGGYALPRVVYVLYNNCGMASSSVNPFVYGAMNRVFRKQYAKILGLEALRKKTRKTRRVNSATGGNSSIDTFGNETSQIREGITRTPQLTEDIDLTTRNNHIRVEIHR